ncbi:MAG: thiamine-phosphate kinase, partial [Bryobacteraceae bacterium]
MALSSERGWIEYLTGRSRTLPGGSGVVVGIGDDCAIFRPAPREDLLFTTDLVIEGVHFDRELHPPEAVGHRAMMRGLSDIAAMGGEARFCLVSIALAPWSDQGWVDKFWSGFLRQAMLAGAPLIGGDTARGERFTCDVAVGGAAPKGKALLRSGARAGDRLYVSGALGGSALGLVKKKGPAWKHHLAPQPRLALGRFVRETLRATACMDLSDGLSIDLHRMCRASMASAEIEPPPRYPGATLEQALHGGEDYELLFAAPARVRPPAEFEGVPITCIGRIAGGKPGQVKLGGTALQPLGFDHFRKT